MSFTRGFVKLRASTGKGIEDCLILVSQASQGGQAAVKF